MGRTVNIRLLLALAWPVVTSAAPGVQEVLTPAQYFQCQIAAREATIKGLEQRAAQASRVGLTQAEKRASAEVSRGRVTAAMYQCGRQNASTLGAYAHRNSDALQTWLNANPSVQVRLDAQRKRIASLSGQMPAVLPSTER